MILTPSPVPRIRALDGLRGFAILMVVCGHLSLLEKGPAASLFAWLQGVGWVGVDLFFVLSGFLITGILLDTRGTPGWLASFYTRRALKILPLYGLLLFLYGVLCPWLFPAGRGIAPEVWLGKPEWYLTFLFNFRVAALGEFPYEPLAVAWSLCIEEQFYLLWPWVVLRCPSRTVGRVALGAVAFSMVARAFAWAGGASAFQMYVATPTRLDALGVGAFLAVAWRDPLLRQTLERYRGWAFAAGLVSVLGCALAEPWLLHSPWGELTDALVLVSFPALAVTFGALLVHALVSGGRWLESRPLGFLGRVSYPLYLTNNAFILAAQRWGWDPNRFDGPEALLHQGLFYVGMGLATVVLAWSLHVAVERPMLRLKRRFPRPPPLPQADSAPTSLAA